MVRHKWTLYARTRLVIRAVIYLFYALVNTVFAILFSKVCAHAVSACISACVRVPVCAYVVARCYL